MCVLCSGLRLIRFHVCGLLFRCLMSGGRASKQPRTCCGTANGAWSVSWAMHCLCPLVGFGGQSLYDDPGVLPHVTMARSVQHGCKWQGQARCSYFG